MGDKINLIFQLFTVPHLLLRDHRIGTVITLIFGVFSRISEVFAVESSDVSLIVATFDFIFSVKGG